MFSKKRKGLDIILIIGLMIIVGRGYADLSVSAVADYTERQCVIEGNYPKVGEIFTVKYRVRLKEGVPLTANYYVSMSARKHDPVEIIDDQEIKIQGLSCDAWKEVRLRAKITEPALTVKLIVNIRLEGTRDRAATRSVKLVLIDPLTGQYGKKEEHNEQLYAQLFKGAEWHYDPAGEFVGAPDHVSPDCAKKNLEIIARIQKINPELTDWEIIHLHYDGIQAVMGGIGTKSTTEEEIWRFLLESGWLDKPRVDKDMKDPWLKKLINKYKGKPLVYEQLFKGAEWHYDPAGEFVGAPDHVSPDCAKKNLEIIALIQKINPELTDWEVIYLHYDGMQAVMGGIGTKSTTEEEIWRFLLESGWLDKQRVDKDMKEQWLKKLINKYKGKPLVMKEGWVLNFFVILLILALLITLIVLKAGGHIFTSKDNSDTKIKRDGA